MKKILLGILSLFIFASICFAGSTNTKQKFVSDLPTDVNIVNVKDNWENLPAASTSTILAVSISTQALVANTTTYTLAAGDYTDVIFPRNIVVDMYFSSGESTTTATGTLTVTGYNQFNVAKTETITISTNSATGNIAWSRITSLDFSDVEISSASVANVGLYVGMGTKIGISNNIESTTADMIKVIEAGATSTIYTANATYDTIAFASAPDGSKDYTVYYNARSNTSRYKY